MSGNQKYIELKKVCEDFITKKINIALFVDKLYEIDEIK